MTVRDAVPADTAAMAELADRKRQQYRDHAAPFQRPAANARRIHEEFLPRLLAWEGFEALVHEVDGAVDGFAVVSGPPSIDEPKTRFLASAGLAPAAEWWVKPTVPAIAAVPEQEGFEAAVGPAPPVYDPGGLTCLALTLSEPAAVARFERFAAASEAVVAIVPVTVDRTDVRDELRRRGYTVASEWYAGPVGR